MGACNLIQWHDLRDVESLPARLKCPIDVASRFDLCFDWHIIAADEEKSGFHENKLPNRNLRHWGIRSVGCDGTALCQYLRVGLDVSPERNLHHVMNSVRS